MSEQARTVAERIAEQLGLDSLMHVDDESEAIAAIEAVLTAYAAEIWQAAEAREQRLREALKAIDEDCGDPSCRVQQICRAALKEQEP